MRQVCTKSELRLAATFSGCFNEGKLIVLFNGFQKKTQKNPKNEIEKAQKLITEYFLDKVKNSDHGK
jgi:phage-related protein